MRVNNRMRFRFLSIVAAVLMVILGGGIAWAAPVHRFVDVATGVDAGNDCTVLATPCKTINWAIGQAVAGDQINVAAGTYPEQVSIDKTLLLAGAQNGVDARNPRGAESIIDNACGPVQIRADNVILDGFTIQGATTSDPCFLAGIWTNPGANGTQGGHWIRDNIIQNNISGIELDSTCVNATLVERNLIRDNNNPGPGSGNGIQTNFGLCNANIVDNKFSGHVNASMLIAGVASDDLDFSNNELVGGAGTADRVAWAGVTNSVISGNKSDGSTATNGPVRLFGGNSNITVTGNVLINGVRGMSVVDLVGTPNSLISAHDNCFVGNTAAGLEVGVGGHSGTLDAENNWWGAATGPTIASNPGGTGDKIIDPDAVVDFTPFLTAPASACEAPEPPCPIEPALSDFRDVRRANNISVGPDLGGTGHTAINFTGSAGAAGDTWSTVYDETPGTPDQTNFTGSINLSADVLSHAFNNKKGAGLLALYNEANGKKGLALIIYNNGNSDSLALVTLNHQTGKLVVLKTMSLGSAIAQNQWYRLNMDVAVTVLAVTVTGTVDRHSVPSNPDSPLGTQVGGVLTFTGTLGSGSLAGVDATGEVGIMASATSATVDSSVTNFSINSSSGCTTP